jgi:hypothetical protein
VTHWNLLRLAVAEAASQANSANLAALSAGIAA